MDTPRQRVSITTRRFPWTAPPSRQSEPPQAVVLRLLHAAIFAPAAGELDLRGASVEQDDHSTSKAAAALPLLEAAPAPLAASPNITATPLIQPVSSLAFYTRGQATQSGILRTRPSNELIGTQSEGATRLKKKVRLESPIGRQESVEPKPASVPSSGGRGQQEVTVEVQPPSSGTSGGADETGAVDTGPDVSVDAIPRCIPFPYRHLDNSLPSTYNPARQHPAKIRHSFVDPLSPSPATTLRGASKRSLSTLDHPRALARLAPGRRGSWVIPVSGPLPFPHASPPSWTSSTGASASTLALPRSKKRHTSRLRKIDWTDARLVACWTILTRLHLKSSMGEIKATGYTPCSTPSMSTAPSSSSPAQWPDHIRVSGDAHLALPLRSLFNFFSVKAADGEGDAVNFLDGIQLVWVDEAGRPVLAA